MHLSFFLLIQFKNTWHEVVEYIYIHACIIHTHIYIYGDVIDDDNNEADGKDDDDENNHNNNN